MDFTESVATAARRWGFDKNNRALTAFLGEREHKVITSLGTTHYMRFGVLPADSCPAKHSCWSDSGSEPAPDSLAMRASCPIPHRGHIGEWLSLTIARKSMAVRQEQPTQTNRGVGCPCLSWSHHSSP